MKAGAVTGDPLPATIERRARLLSTLSNSAAPFVANGFSAVANTAAVFALSTSAGLAFPTFAASTAALILSYGTARSLLGEPLMLTQRDRQTGTPAAFPTMRGWTSASLAVGVVLGTIAALGLELAGVEGVGLVTLGAVVALIFNDAARHLCFARGSSWTAAIADGGLAGLTLMVWVLAPRFSPHQVYGSWLVGAACAGVFMLQATAFRVHRSDAVPDSTAEIPALHWMRGGWNRTRWLAAEAVAVTAAVTLPLILAADDVAGPGRLLLSWFGFQQILFFAAYAVATRNPMRASRTTVVLFCAGAAGSIVVGVGVAFFPGDLLVRLFGPSAQTAQGWALWFAGTQLLTAAGNAAALGARLISGERTTTATKLFRARLLFAGVSTVGGVIGALTIGIAGYIAGSALGAALHVVVSIRILRAGARPG